jgi:hypothetical protein
MTSERVEIEVRELRSERERAQDDLQRTLQALEEKVLPGRSVHRLVVENDPALVLTGVAAAGLAVGLVRDESPTTRAVALAAAMVAGAILFGLRR